MKRFFTETYRRLMLYTHVRWVRPIVRRQRRTGGRVRLLDVGCGDGLFLEGCGIPLGRTAGLDCSLAAVRAAGKRGVGAVRGSLLDFPFAEKTFSIVTMFHVFEHLTRPDAHLRAVRRMLTQDGDLLIQVPNADSLQAGLFKGRWAGFDPPWHLIHYSPETLKEVLRRNRFKVIRCAHFSLRDNAAMAARSLFPEIYPPVRAIRETSKSSIGAWGADLLFFSAVTALQPFAMLEGFLGRGAAVMVHAKPG